MLRIVLTPVLAFSLLASSTLCCCLTRPAKAVAEAQPSCCCHEATREQTRTPQPKQESCTCKQKQPQAVVASAFDGGSFMSRVLPHVDLAFSVRLLSIAEAPAVTLALLPAGWFEDSQAILRAHPILRL